MVIITVRAGLHPRPAVSDKPITGRFGTPIPLEVFREGERYVVKDLSELKADDLDALIVPGGFSPDALRIRKDVLNFVKEMHAKGKIIAAICHGPQVLISAGLVKDKRCTSCETVRDDLINAGAQFVDEPAVRDGNLITAGVPDDLPEFCQLIIDALSSLSISRRES